MDRPAALDDFEAARREWEEAFGRVPDAALTYLKEGDDYSLGGLQVHVNWVLAHYRRVLDAIVAAGFEQLRAHDPPGAEQKALEGARRGLDRAGRVESLKEMGRLHARVRDAVERLPESDWTRKAPVVYGEGEDPFPTCPEDILGWLREHYREHVVQSAELIEDWRRVTEGG